MEFNTLKKHADIFNSTAVDTKARLELLHGNMSGGLLITLMCMAVLCFSFDTPDQQAAKTTIFFVLVFSHTVRLIDNLWTTKQLKKSDCSIRLAVWRLSGGIVTNSLIWASFSVIFVADMESSEITATAIVMSALAGGAITILAASYRLSIGYMSSLILPFSVMGLFNNVEYIHYISLLGFTFWFVMLMSAGQVGKFISQTLSLKNENNALLDLMDVEKQEVERVNSKLTVANEKLDKSIHSLEAQVEKRTKDIYRLSNLDPLTNLMNRSAFLLTLKKLLSHETLNDETYALFFIDLNGFKDVNDGFGHKAGDDVLSEIAQRLKKYEKTLNVGETQNNILCRWGGDEFLLLVSCNQNFLIRHLANDIQKSVANPISVASTRVALSASIGIAEYPKDSTDTHELIQYADISMYHHKKHGVDDATFFSPALFLDFKRDQMILDGLKYALIQEEFSIFYQPIVDIEDNKVWAVEALLRWSHNDQPISPDEFIPIAEKSGRIIEIGAWVINTACKHAMQWECDSAPSLSVNVSALQLLDKGFINIIERALEESGLRPQRLHIEITESVMLENGALAHSQLKAIADMGIHISIDDFGTGFSSLNQLQKMSFNVIKIDRSFLQGLNRKDLTIISATKLIADEFQAKTVAEGIETARELKVLKDIGIRYIQGYLFAKPMPREKICHWIETFSSNQ